MQTKGPNSPSKVLHFVDFNFILFSSLCSLTSLFSPSPVTRIAQYQQDLKVILELLNDSHRDYQVIPKLVEILNLVTLWKRQYFLKSRKLNLIKHTPSSFLIYFISSFVIPRKIHLRLQKIQRDFLWGKGILWKQNLTLWIGLFYVCPRKRVYWALETYLSLTRAFLTRGIEGLPQKGSLRGSRVIIMKFREEICN